MPGGRGGAVMRQPRLRPDRGLTMGLESETLRRMAECFGGRACRRCGRAAVRLAHGRFYCDRHLPPSRGEMGRPPKTYRCQLRGEGSWRASPAAL